MTDLFQRLRARSEILHQQLWARYAVFRLELHQRTTVAQRRIGAVALILLLVVIVGLWIRGRGTTAPHAAVPLPVVAATAETGDMPITYTALGTVTPLASVTVKSQINGYLAQIEFREGQEVNAGDALAEIDPRPYQAALEQAQGQLQRDQAQLEGARVDLARYRTLLAQDSIAKQTYDDQVATVHQLEGTVQLDQGIVANAKVNLAYCHITAPVAGRLGLRQVNAGAKGTVRQTTGSNGGTAAPASAPPAGNSPTDNSQSGGQRRSRSSP